MKHVTQLWWLGALVWLTACTSPQSRIDRAPAAFARLPAEQQALIRQGKVSIGFGQEAVTLALGEPDRRWTRTEASGTSELWTYTSWEASDGTPLLRGGYHRWRQDFYATYPLTTYPHREREYLKLTLRDGLVTAIETETP